MHIILKQKKEFHIFRKKGRCIRVFLLNPILHSKKSLPESEQNNRKGTPGCTWQRGSMTVEAAVVLPILVCALAFFLFLFRMIQVGLSVQQVLEEAGREIAVYAQCEREEDVAETVYLGMAKGIVWSKLRQDSNIGKYVEGKTAGISLAESSFRGDEICLQADYRMKFPVTLLGKKVFWMSQTTRYRKWTGWSVGQGDTDGETWVFVTETGTVYHRTASCSYLTLTIRSVDEAAVGDCRNESGGKYERCEKCAGKENRFQKVYITNYGDRYHTDLNCSGIKRTVEMVRVSEVEGKGACSKCWKQ